jgi:hypothetical protein
MNVAFLSWNAFARDDKTLVYTLWENNEGKGLVRALDLSDGSMKWTYTAQEGGILSLTIVNGIVYFVEWDEKTLTALNIENGLPLATETGELFRTKVIFADSRLFVGLDKDPRIGAAVAEYTSSSSSVEEVSFPANEELLVWPNPVMGQGYVAYSLHSAAEVTLQVLDVLGKHIGEMDLGRCEPGTHTARMGSAVLPATLPAGVYTVVLKAGEQIARKNVLLIR